MLRAMIELVTPGPSEAVTAMASRIAGEGVGHVHDPHQHGARQPAYGGGHGANQRAEQRGDQDRDDAGQQREASAVEQPDHDVAALFVGAEQMIGRANWLQAGRDIALERVGKRQNRRDQRRAGDQQQQAEREECSSIAAEPGGNLIPVGSGRDAQLGRAQLRGSAQGKCTDAHVALLAVN